MTKPFYQEQGITIYCADCRDILPQLPQVDLVLTDPPYVGLKGGLLLEPGEIKKGARSKTVGDEWGASLDWVPLCRDKANYGLLIFCSQSFVSELGTLFPPDKRVSLITWYKRNSPLAVRNVPHFTCEYIWAIREASGLKWKELEQHYDIPTLNQCCSERITSPNGLAAHPTQKPLSLISKLLKVGGDTVLDPFMGSGTTLVAVKKLGRKAIGIEISEKYCQIAAERLRQAVMPLEIPEPKPESKQQILSF